MALDHYFSEKDPQVVEAVEKQYLYGRTKEVLQNIEKDILSIVKEVTRAHRLEIEYPDRISEMRLIGIALSQLNQRSFTEGEMKILEVFRRRCHAAMNGLMDLFDLHDSSGYAKAASSLLGSLYSLNPPQLRHDSMEMKSDNDGQRFFTTALEVLEVIDRTSMNLKDRKNKKKS